MVDGVAMSLHPHFGESEFSRKGPSNPVWCAHSLFRATTFLAKGGLGLHAWFDMMQPGPGTECYFRSQEVWEDYGLACLDSVIALAVEGQQGRQTRDLSGVSFGHHVIGLTTHVLTNGSLYKYNVCKSC